MVLIYHGPYHYFSVDGHGDHKGGHCSKISLKSDSCHDANFVITGGTSIMTISGAASDDEVGIMTALHFQWWCNRVNIDLDQDSTKPLP